MKDIGGVLVSSAPPVLPMAAWAAFKLRKIPYWYVIYDLEPDRAIVMAAEGAQGRKAEILGKWQRRWLHSADKVVAIGRCMRDHVIKNYDLDPDQVVSIPVGEDDQAVSMLPKAGLFREEFESDPFLVLYSGNFGRYHDFGPILDAAEKLSSHSHIQFLLVGGGRKDAELRREVDERGLRNLHVREFVPSDQFQNLLAAADICLITLERGMEGLCVPSKLYSILAAGRPSIALVPEVTETARAIRESDCGYVLEEADGERLAEVILEAESDEDRLEEMGLRAREALVSKYSSTKIAEQFAEMMKG
jgi:glycosyltransferase involved in cell wall biosynthesis